LISLSRRFDLRWLSLKWFSRDGKILLITKFLRTLAFGYLSVALPYYFGRDVLNLPDVLVGVILTAALWGGLAFTIIAGLIANKVSRRTSLNLFALLMMTSGILLIAATNLVIIFLAVFIGSIGVNATETGPFASMEQAMMPQTTDVENRTYAFSVYNLLGYAGASFGSLLGGLPAVAHSYFGFTLINGHRILFALYALTGLLLVILYRSLSRKAEVEVTGTGLLGLTKSRLTVAKLSVLFSIDAFGGGFVIQSVLSLWFQAKYNTPLSAASGILFVAQLITAASFLIAGRLAKKIGLLNTMILTHVPSNLLLMGVGLAPTFETSVGFLFARQTLSQMDVPTRQSYMLAIIEPEERNAATSITNVSRTAVQSIPPPIASYLIGAALFTELFIFAGVFKIVYDISIYLSFRKVKPPEEKK
jgi:MFS family permease